MKVVHDVRCPVWTHSLNATNRSSTLTAVSKILCALELTEEAVPLLMSVKDLAAECSASVRLVHSVPEMESRPYRYFDADLHGYLKNCAANEIPKYQHEAGTDFPVTIVDGPIAQDMATLAADGPADLVVIGRGKTQEVLGTLRTHAYDIIRRAPCAVLSYCSARSADLSPASANQSQSEPALSTR